jgi:hypothetical protein
LLVCFISTGTTHCPGRKFIRSEVKLFFIFLILNLDFKLKENQPKAELDGKRAGVGIYPPKEDVLVIVSRK